MLILPIFGGILGFSVGDATKIALGGLIRRHVLFVIEVASRKVEDSGMTSNRAV